REDLPRAQQARRTVPTLRRGACPRRLRGAHDLLLPRVPDRGPRAQGPAALASVAVIIEQVTEADEELVETVRRLPAHLTEARTPPTLEQLSHTAANQTLLVARDDDGSVLGMLTFVLYRVSSGLKGRIEDVVVDEAARGRGVGEALTREGMRRANEAGVLML